MAGPRKPTHEEKIVLELSSIKASINNLTKAIRAHSANTGKWLAAIALAAANPEDTSTEVQRALDQIAAEINASSDEVEAEIDNQTKGE